MVTGHESDGEAVCNLKGRGRPILATYLPCALSQALKRQNQDETSHFTKNALCLPSL